MSDVDDVQRAVHEWVEQTIINGAVAREEQIRMVVRPRPRWFPDPIWRRILRRLLVMEVRR